MKIGREFWKIRWHILTTDKKVAYITVLYEKEQKINEKKLEKTKKVYNYFNIEYGMSPNKALAVLDAPLPEKGKIEKVGGFLANAFTVGEFSKKKMEEQYNKMKRVYDYYDSVYKIAFANAMITNTEYDFVCRKADLYIQKFKELIEDFNYEQKKQFDRPNRWGWLKLNSAN
jgi:hypothetical protein